MSTLSLKPMARFVKNEIGTRVLGLKSKEYEIRIFVSCSILQNEGYLQHELYHYKTELDLVFTDRLNCR